MANGIMLEGSGIKLCIEVVISNITGPASAPGMTMGLSKDLVISNPSPTTAKSPLAKRVPLSSIPIGVRAHLDVTDDRASLTVLESPVA